MVVHMLHVIAGLCPAIQDRCAAAVARDARVNPGMTNQLKRMML